MTGLVGLGVLDRKGKGRSTGIPKMLKVMAKNRSLAPEFETDEVWASFVIHLPVRAGAKLQLEREAPHVTPEVERLLRVSKGNLLRR